MTKSVRAVPRGPRARLALRSHHRATTTSIELDRQLPDDNMSKSAFCLVSLPTSISPSNDSDEALTALRAVVSTDNGTTYPFNLPSFKIGTLDALVQQADDLQKLEQGCKGVVEKVADSLRNILEGDEDKMADQKNVNDKPVDHYLQTFQWNKVKYRADKPISELVDMLQKVCILYFCLHRRIG
jgi:V-type H+-transporting ATPase subunit C